jgi:uncharacterized protein with GYD domain
LFRDWEGIGFREPPKRRQRGSGATLPPTERKGGIVPTYVVLLNWTDQGVRSYKDTLDRAEAASKALEALGGRMKDLYWTLGPHDVVAIAEAPDDETATAFALATGAQGSIRSTTLRAFDREEVKGILAKVG